MTRDEAATVVVARVDALLAFTDGISVVPGAVTKDNAKQVAALFLEAFDTEARPESLDGAEVTARLSCGRPFRWSALSRLDVKGEVEGERAAPLVHPVAARRSVWFPPDAPHVRPSNNHRACCWPPAQ